MSTHKELAGRLRELLAHARENWGEYRGLLSLDAALEEVRVDTLSPPDGVGLTRTWHIGAQNDGLFIIDRPPSASNDHPVHEYRQGISPDLVLPLEGPASARAIERAQAIVSAHNAALAAKDAEIATLRAYISEADEVAEAERDALKAAAKTVVTAAAEFRAGMTPEWGGDPLSDACEALDAALSTLPAPAARWRHVKRGTEYEVIGIGKMQSSEWADVRTYHAPAGYPSIDLREVVIYRSLADGSLWARPREEFYDGRFVQVPAPAASGEG